MRGAEAEERRKQHEAELKRQCHAESSRDLEVAISLAEQYIEEARQAEEEVPDADEMVECLELQVECLELQVAGWTLQWAEVLRADEAGGGKCNGWKSQQFSRT